MRSSSGPRNTCVCSGARSEFVHIISQPFRNLGEKEKKPRAKTAVNSVLNSAGISQTEGRSIRNIKSSKTTPSPRANLEFVQTFQRPIDKHLKASSFSQNRKRRVGLLGRINKPLAPYQLFETHPQYWKRTYKPHFTEMPSLVDNTFRRYFSPIRAKRSQILAVVTHSQLRADPSHKGLIRTQKPKP